jgi:hypothetical protein
MIEENIMKAKLFFLLIFMQVMFSCVSIVYYEGNYHGKVIDSKTREPIEGAVVLGVWYKVYIGPGGEAHEYYDSRETVTDKKGEFAIKGMRPRVMTHLEKMDIVIFKAGYEDIYLDSWESLKSVGDYRDRFEWEGNKAIISLEKWTVEQRRRRFSASPAGVPIEKQKMLLKEIRKDRNEIK